jgi:hypothetical protein
MFTLKSYCTVLAACVLLAIAGSACATTITVPNYEFDNPVVTQYNSGPITSWTITNGNAGLYNSAWANANSGFALPPNSSSQFMWLNADTSGVFGVYQVLSATLQANTTYTLMVDVALQPPTTTMCGGVALGYGSTFQTNDLTATTSSTPTPTPSGSWTTWTITYTTGSSPAGLGQALRVELSTVPTGVTGAKQLAFDNVRLTSVSVPEPSTLALLAAGLAGLVCYAWRKRR